MNEEIEVDDLRIEVRRSPRRRTVDLTVDRGGNLVIAVPASLSQSEIQRIIRQKQIWIYNTLGRKREALHPKVEKEYVTGEGFYYLGRKYRLKVLDPEEVEQHTPLLQLKNGRFLIQPGATGVGRQQFIRYYRNQGQRWIPDAVDMFKTRVGSEPRRVGIRDLEFRWGSCTSEGDLYFHWRVMLLPVELVHYLIQHELVHLREHDHSAAFYERLQRVVPDCREKDIWLEKNGDKYSL